jgi:hypothetical protein
MLKVDILRTEEMGCYAGLVWGTTKGYYSFRIDDIDQEYSLSVYDRDASDNKFPTIINWTKTDIIRASETNRMAVIVDESLIRLYINEQLIKEVDITYVSADKVGVQVAVCNENSQVTFEFDNFELRAPE